jgi:hypothetical protein
MPQQCKIIVGFLLGARLTAQILELFEGKQHGIYHRVLSPLLVK